MTGPGRLKTRLVIEAPVETDDGEGGVTSAYAAVATVWASLRPGPAQRSREAEADGAVVPLRLVLRSGFDLTLRHRFNDGGRIYRITGLREISDRRFVEVAAEWRID